MTIKLFTTLPLLILFVTLPSGMHRYNFPATGSGAWPISPFTGGATVVDLVLLECSPKQLKFQVRIKNTGERAVLIVGDPVRVDGDRGAYLSLDERDPGLLEIAFPVFPLPVYTLLATKNRVSFLRLDPGATHVEDVVWDEPFKDTNPPGASGLIRSGLRLRTFGKSSRKWVFYLTTPPCMPHWLT